MTVRDFQKTRVEAWYQTLWPIVGTDMLEVTQANIVVRQSHDLYRVKIMNEHWRIPGSRSKMGSIQFASHSIRASFRQEFDLYDEPVRGPLFVRIFCELLGHFTDHPASFYIAHARQHKVKVQRTPVKTWIKQQENKLTAQRIAKELLAPPSIDADNLAWGPL